jgi:hypothetical protein
VAACGDDAASTDAATATTTTSTIAASTTVPSAPDPRVPRIGGSACGDLAVANGLTASEFDLVNVTCDEAHAFASDWSDKHESTFTGEEQVDTWICRASVGKVACVAMDQTRAMGWHLNP